MRPDCGVLVGGGGIQGSLRRSRRVGRFIRDVLMAKGARQRTPPRVRRSPPPGQSARRRRPRRVAAAALSETHRARRDRHDGRAAAAARPRRELRARLRPRLRPGRGDAGGGARGRGAQASGICFALIREPTHTAPSAAMRKARRARLRRRAGRRAGLDGLSRAPPPAWARARSPSRCRAATARSSSTWRPRRSRTARSCRPAPPPRHRPPNTVLSGKRRADHGFRAKRRFRCRSAAQKAPASP